MGRGKSGKGLRLFAAVCSYFLIGMMATTIRAVVKVKK